MTMLDLIEDHFTEDVWGLLPSELLDGVRFVRGRSEEAPGWWAEVVYELREQRREDREDASFGGFANLGS